MDDLLMFAFDWIMKHSWAQYVVAGAGAAKAVSIIFPSTWQGQAWYNYLMKVINVFAGEVGNAKNADDKPLSVANAK